MNVPETLKYIRLKKELKQSDVKISKTASNLSRFENGDRDIKINNLEKIIESFDMHPSEFFHLATNDNYRKIVDRAVRVPKDSLNIDYLKETYYNEKYKYSDKSSELAYYYATKAYFLVKWDLPTITKKELEHVFNHLIRKNYYGRFDYMLMANTIHFFETKRSLIIVKKMFPFPEREEKMEHNAKRFAFSGLINAITKQSYDRNYTAAREIIEIAENVSIDNKNYYFRFSIQYFKNILDYRETKDIKYLNKVYTYIDLIKDIGDTEMATELEVEVKNLMFNDEIIDICSIDPTLIKEQ